MSYQILSVVDVPAPTMYFPGMTECVGEYVVAEFDDFPMDHTEIIGEHLKEMKEKLEAAGYDPETEIHNAGNNWEFGSISVGFENAIVRLVYKYN